jgi:hypothetical protein
VLTEVEVNPKEPPIGRGQGNVSVVRGTPATTVANVAHTPSSNNVGTPWCQLHNKALVPVPHAKLQVVDRDALVGNVNGTDNATNGTSNNTLTTPLDG